MSKADEYRLNAEECHRMADNTRNPTDKSNWLRLAEKWQRMIRPDASQRASDTFDAVQKRRGTGQEDSESSH